MAFPGMFHYGILVPRLEAAISFYESAFGLTFLPPLATFYPRVQQKDGDAPFSARITYSRSGPIHLELLEAEGTGLWAPQPGDHVHHIGLWAEEPLRMAADLESKGFEWEAHCYGADGAIPVVFVRRGAVRLELVDAQRRPKWTDWVAGKIRSPR
ncbi:VOC family protein [Pendulispora brunnea]|uniref:VOC family protein n=1 Tax=Pendulispora brunnea TaxID=2905690 RepID=A0ABZ2KSB0_9BACT